MPHRAHPPRRVAQAAATSARAARRPLRARRRHRRGAQRAHPRRPLAARPRPAGDAGGGRRGHARAVDRARIVNHDGQHYTVENARLTRCPTSRRRCYVSAFGPKAIDLAARIGDGFCDQPGRRAASALPRAAAARDRRRAASRSAGAPTRTRASSRRTGCGRTPALPGELAQVLPTPAPLRAGVELVTADMIGEAVICGPDLERLHRGPAGVRRRRLRRLYVSRSARARRSSSSSSARGPPPLRVSLVPAPGNGWLGTLSCVSA